jgi:hypothetical protein
MSLTTEDFMGALPQEFEASCFGRQVAARLVAMHPVHTAKHVARALTCAPKTAENILAGHLSARSITRLTIAYGLGFLIDVGAAVTGTTLREHIIEQANQARREQRRAEAREREFIELEEGLAARRFERPGHDRRLP